MRAQCIPLLHFCNISTRYFVLADNTLWYFKDKETAAVGSEETKVDLQRASVRQTGSRGTYYVEFVYSAPGGIVETMTLKAPTQSDAQVWVDKVDESKTATAYIAAAAPGLAPSPGASVPALPPRDTPLSSLAAPPHPGNTSSTTVPYNRRPSSSLSRRSELVSPPSPAHSSASVQPPTFKRLCASN